MATIRTLLNTTKGIYAQYEDNLATHIWLYMKVHQRLCHPQSASPREGLIFSSCGALSSIMSYSVPSALRRQRQETRAWQVSKRDVPPQHPKGGLWTADVLTKTSGRVEVSLWHVLRVLFALEIARSVVRSRRSQDLSLSSIVYFIKAQAIQVPLLKITMERSNKVSDVYAVYSNHFQRG